MRPIVHLEPSPESQLLGTAVLFRGRTVVGLHRIVVEQLRLTEVRDGIAPPTHLLQAQAALQAARDAIAAQGSPDASDITDVRSRATSRKSVQKEQIDTREVARMLGVGDRQARRIAESLGGRKRHGRWTFDRRDVEAYRQAAG